MGKQKRSRQKFHNAAVKPKGDKKQDEDSAMEVRKINILFSILKCGCNNSIWSLGIKIKCLIYNTFTVIAFTVFIDIIQILWVNTFLIDI